MVMKRINIYTKLTKVYIQFYGIKYMWQEQTYTYGASKKQKEATQMSKISEKQDSNQQRFARQTQILEG